MTAFRNTNICAYCDYHEQVHNNGLCPVEDIALADQFDPYEGEGATLVLRRQTPEPATTVQLGIAHSTQLSATLDRVVFDREELNLLILKLINIRNEMACEGKYFSRDDNQWEPCPQHEFDCPREK